MAHWPMDSRTEFVLLTISAELAQLGIDYYKMHRVWPWNHPFIGDLYFEDAVKRAGFSELVDGMDSDLREFTQLTVTKGALELIKRASEDKD